LVLQALASSAFVFLSDLLAYPKPLIVAVAVAIVLVAAVAALLADGIELGRPELGLVAFHVPEFEELPVSPSQLHEQQHEDSFAFANLSAGGLVARRNREKVHSVWLAVDLVEVEVEQTVVQIGAY
jgi:hypothetical protein